MTDPRRTNTCGGSSESGWWTSRTPATSWCCGRRRARPTGSGRRSTARVCPRSWARWPATTRCSSSPPSRPVERASLAGYASWPRAERERERQEMAKRVVLAYSGGLDTSVAVRWLREERGVEVIALAADVGQGGDFESLRERALAAGAIDALVIDCVDEFADDYVARALKANALYEGRYPLVSSLSRPIIVRHLVEAARAHGADAVAHGCTGKGNDQVRFEVSARALAPDLEVMAPIRDWDLTREQSLEYARRYEIPVTVTKESLYSIDENLWGKAIETGVLEDPWHAPPEDIFTMTVPTASEPVEIVVSFEQGLPVALDG